MILRRRIENVSNSNLNEFGKVYLKGLANRIEEAIRPSSLVINKSELKFETNLENNFSFNFLRSFFSFTVDKACIHLEDKGDYLTVNYEVKFLRALILGLFPAIAGSVVFAAINQLKIEGFILTFIVVYGSFTIMILLFGFVSLICLQHILIEEIDLTERRFRKTGF